MKRLVSFRKLKICSGLEFYLVMFWANLSKPVTVYENVLTVRGTLHNEHTGGVFPF